MYVVQDGELKTKRVNVGKNRDIQRDVYVSGAKVTADIEEATEFETAEEASKYQCILGLQGRRGQLVNAQKERVKYPPRPKPVLDPGLLKED